MAAGWNRGLTKETNSSLMSHSLLMKEKFKTGELKPVGAILASKEELSSRAKKIWIWRIQARLW